MCLHWIEARANPKRLQPPCYVIRHVLRARLFWRKLCDLFPKHNDAMWAVLPGCQRLILKSLCNRLYETNTVSASNTYPSHRRLYAVVTIIAGAYTCSSQQCIYRSSALKCNAITFGVTSSNA